MPDSFSKKEKEKKKAQKRKEKQARKEAKKGEEKKNKLEDMLAYVDADGNIVDTPPDLTQPKKEIAVEDIEIGVPKREEIAEDTVLKGKVSFFNNDKGYGFIKQVDSEESYFVHINSCLDPIGENDKVEFELEKGDRGMVAVNVKKV